MVPVVLTKVDSPCFVFHAHGPTRHDIGKKSSTAFQRRIVGHPSRDIRHLVANLRQVVFSFLAGVSKLLKN